MSNFLIDEMDSVEADGVDFVPVFYDMKIAPIICSYTRKEVEDLDYYPKSGRRYWKIVNGNKEYI